MVSICFRFDDASAKSDHKLEHKVFDVFARLDVPLCVAVIPFAGASKPVPLSPAEQTRLIREGMHHLASAFNQRIQGFVPPWNTYDAWTTQALTDAGFEFLSAGFDVYRYGRLPVVPITCTLRTARIAIQKVCCFKWLAPVVVVVFHTDDFIEHRYPPRHDESWPAMSLSELEALLRWIRTKPGLHIEPLSHIAIGSANGSNLRSSSELTLPYRVKVLVPPMLVRSAGWRTLPGILWGMSRNRSAFDADSEAEPKGQSKPVVLDAHHGKHF